MSMADLHGKERRQKGAYGASLICFGVLFASLFELGGTSYFLPSSSSFLGLSFTMLSYISSRLCWAVLVPRSAVFLRIVVIGFSVFDSVRKVVGVVGLPFEI